MSILIENKLSYDNSNDSFIVFLIFIVVVVVILSIYKARQNKSEIDFEQKIINTISSNRIIDPAFFIGLNEEDLKTAIIQEILKINKDWKFKKKFIDLPKMTLLMEKLEFQNLQKLYQWFFYKG
jgi:hypothetical protein|tara:strand:+ start:70 stop:441 length:372 start_codon:yes stop_codon:yes gene_type:complete